MNKMSVWSGWSVFEGSLFRTIRRTNVKQDCAIFLLVHDMVLEDLIVESSGS